MQNDAIGTDVMALHAQLTTAGWQVFVYTAAYDPAFASHVTKKISRLVSDPQAVLLYVNGWVWGEGEVLATAFAGRRVMRFHAGPSPRFFRPYDQVYLSMVKQYWAQTRRVVPFFDLFLPVSEFAASTLLKLAADRERIRVVSVFNRVDELGATVPDPWRVDALRKESHRKVLSVARVTAQKGQRHILEVARCYKEQYGNGIRFYFVGRFGPDGYCAEMYRGSAGNGRLRAFSRHSIVACVWSLPRVSSVGGGGAAFSCARECG